MSPFDDPASDLNLDVLPTTLVFCKPPPWSQFLIVIPLAIQCAFLHPIFRNSSLARWVRLILVAPNLHWCIYLSWTYCFTPLELSAEMNMILSSVTLTLAMKTIEWGFVEGPYWSRTSVLRNDYRQWDASGAIQQHDLNAGSAEVVFWTFAQFTTMRGYQFSWGLKADKEMKPRGVIGLVRRLLISHFAFVLATAFLVWRRDSKIQLLSGSLGVRALGLLGEALYTLAFGVTIGAAMDMRYSALQLLTGLLHWMWPSAPRIVADYLDPALHPPVFGTISQARSLAAFWSSAWHSLFRRSFLFCGGRPLAVLAKRAGFGISGQRVALLIGVFGASGILHEYALAVFARPPHGNPYVFPQSTLFLGPAFYFLVQPLGILLEARIKRLSGPVWVWMFTLTTATTLRRAYLGPGRLDARLPPLSEWGWAQWIIPMALHS